MLIPSRLKPIFRTSGLTALPILSIALALCAWAGLAGCKTVEIDAPPKDSTLTTADSATLRVTNKIEQDPDSITLLLFSGTTVDIANAAPIKTLNGVAYKATSVMRVPAGTWKLGYRNHAGVLFDMTDANAAAQEWLKAIFVKNADYSLIIASDGNRTTWDPTFITDPVIQ